MKNFIITSLFTFCVNLLFAYSPAILVLKSGEEIECMAKLGELTSKKVKYKLNASDKALVMKKDLIDKIIFIKTDSTSSVYYNCPYVNFNNAYLNRYKSKNNDLWMPLSTNGEVKLFTIFVSGSGANYFRIFCKKPDMDYMVEIGHTLKGFGQHKMFRKIALELFGDCKEIADKLEAKEYKIDDIGEIVEEYNEFYKNKNQEGNLK